MKLRCPSCFEDLWFFDIGREDVKVDVFRGAGVSARVTDMRIGRILHECTRKGGS